MRMSTRVRRTLVTIAAATLVVTGTLSTASAANAAVPVASVTKVAALGDSITLGLMSCSSFSGCPANSWSTGTNAAVISHVARIDAANGTLAAPTGYNYAVSGALSSALNTQAIKAVAQKVQYVTIEIGANDACTRTTTAMTDPTVFGNSIKAALLTLSTQVGGPPQVFVASIPNLDLMRQANAGSSSARFTWSILGICQSLLKNPTSTAVADVTRRQQVMDRVAAFNAQLKAACELPAYASFCRYDQGAVFGTTFDKSHISTRDYFHPSIAGQALLASRTWDAMLWAP